MAKTRTILAAAAAVCLLASTDATATAADIDVVIVSSNVFGSMSCNGAQLQPTGTGSIRFLFNTSTNGGKNHQVVNATVLNPLVYLDQAANQYTVTGKANEVMDYSTATGSFLGGKATYTMTVYDANGAVFGNYSGKTTLTTDGYPIPMSGSC